MPLLRNLKTPFTESYRTLTGDGTGKVSEVSKLMIGFISLVNEIFQETEIGGLTSHASILILDQNDKKSVIGRISAEDLTHYKFEYGEGFLKDSGQNHIVKVPVQNEKGVKEEFLSMLESTGDWNNNKEFIKAKSSI